MKTWRKIADFAKYEASDDGCIRNRESGHVLKPFRRSDGYPCVILSNCDGKSCRSVHRLVAETFIPNPQYKPMVNHIDGDKTNNSVNNLEWSTGSENVRHAYRTGLVDHYKVGVQVIETGEIFNSIRTCATAIDGDCSAICACLHGRLKSHKGYHFRQID